MDNSTKIIITENASEFLQNDLKVFQKFNHSVEFCVKDGEELCSRIQHEQPDVVVMDAFMTRLDAISVMRSVKRQNVKTPLFIVFSSFHSAVLEREIMNNGASYFVLKPYDVEQLCENISLMTAGDNLLSGDITPMKIDKVAVEVSGGSLHVSWVASAGAAFYRVVAVSVEVSTDPAFSQKTTVAGGSLAAAGEQVLAIEGLAGETTYYARAVFAGTRGGSPLVGYSETVSFTTLGAQGPAATLSFNQISFDGAMAVVRVTSLGDDATTTRRWRTRPAPARGPARASATRPSRSTSCSRAGPIGSARP